MFRGFPERKMFDTRVCNACSLTTHTAVGGEEEGAGECNFQFHVTLLPCGTCWSNVTQRKGFCVKLHVFENCYTEYFMIFSRPLLTT